MAATNKKLGLRTDHSSLTPKKYLGEPDDPHFIPDSPLIDRQTITEQEEGELRRICALVLANVPHSDEVSDDPLKYIAAHIEEGRAFCQTDAKHGRAAQSAQNANATSTNVTHRLADLKLDTATPSERSQRCTSTSTNNSTPLTSAGLTPGEPGPRVYDAARRSVTSGRKPESSLRNEALTTTKSRTASNAGLHQSSEMPESTFDPQAMARTLRLVKDTSMSGSSSNKSMELNPATGVAGLDLNKSLPPPPPGTDSPALGNSKQPRIGRLMKTLYKKKSMTHESSSTSTALNPPMPPTKKASAVTNIQPHSPTAVATANARANVAQPPEQRKKRFHLRFFPRLHRPADVLVT